MNRCNGLSDRSLQRVENEQPPTASKLAAAHLGVALECGAEDLFAEIEPLARRISQFEGARPRDVDRPWITRPEELDVCAALAARTPVVLSAAPRMGKTSLARRVVRRMAKTYERGAAWIEGSLPELDRQKAALADMFGFFYKCSGADQNARLANQGFSTIFWARRRLLVVDDVRDPKYLEALLGGYQGPMDLLVLTDRDELSLPDMSLRVVALAPILDAQVFALLMKDHLGDDRVNVLALPAAPTIAVLDAALDGARAAVQAAATWLARSEAAQTQWRTLLLAIAGRPDALALASDQLRRTRFSSLADVARVVEHDKGNECLLRHADQRARRFFHSLAVFGDRSVPVDWAAAVGDVSQQEVREWCDGALRDIVRPGDRSGIAVVPWLQSYAAHGLSPEARAAAVDRLLAKTRDNAFALAARAFDEAMPALLDREELYLVSLNYMLAHADRPIVLETVLALRRLLAGWRTPRIGDLFERCIAAADGAEHVGDAADLRLAYARWHLYMSAAFLPASRLFEEAAAAFGRLGRPLDRAEALVELAVALTAMLRVNRAQEYMAEAVSLTRVHGTPSALALRLNSLALLESRRREGRLGNGGWRCALDRLDEAIAVFNDDSADGEAIRRILVTNRAIIARVLRLRRWKPELEAALRDIIAATPVDSIVHCHILATAVACGLVVLSSAAEQKRRLRRAWLQLLARRGHAVGGAVFILGQMAYYLSHADFEVRHHKLVNDGVMATEGRPQLYRWPLLEIVPLMFYVQPMWDVFDLAFLRRAGAFVRDFGGPDQARVFEEFDRLTVLHHRRRVARPPP